MTKRGLVRGGMFDCSMIVGGGMAEDMAEKMLPVFAFFVTCPVGRGECQLGYRLAVRIGTP